jgi:hypothetical protein
MRLDDNETRISAPQGHRFGVVLLQIAMPEMKFQRPEVLTQPRERDKRSSHFGPFHIGRSKSLRPQLIS